MSSIFDSIKNADAKISASKETLKYIVRECPECGYRGKHISYISDEKGDWCYCSACGTNYKPYKNDPELVEIVQNGVDKIVETIKNKQELSDEKLQTIRNEIFEKLDSLMTTEAFNTAIEELTRKLETASEHSADEIKACIDTQTKAFKDIIKNVTDMIDAKKCDIAKIADVDEKVTLIEEMLKNIDVKAICEKLDIMSRGMNDIKEKSEETNVAIHQVKKTGEDTNVAIHQVKKTGEQTNSFAKGAYVLSEKIWLMLNKNDKNGGDTGKNQQASQQANEMPAPESLTTATVKDAQNEAPESEWSLEKINNDYEAALENIDAIAGQVKKSLKEKSDADTFEKLYDGLGENNQKLFLCMLYMKGAKEKKDNNKLIYYKCEDDECLYAKVTDGKIKIEIAQFVSKDENEIKEMFQNYMSWTETQNAKTRAQMKVLANKLLDLAIDKMEIKCEDKKVLVENCKKRVR